MSGKIFVSVRDFDKSGVVQIAKGFAALGFQLVATRGTLVVLQTVGLAVELVNKVAEGRPHIVDMIKNEEIELVLNTTEGKQAIKDSASIRRSAENHSVYYTTTLAGGEAICQAIKAGQSYQVRRLQELHERILK